VAGVKGDLPSFSIFNNWTYDLYGQASLSRGNYTQTYAPTDRVNAVLGAGPGANGCDPTAMEPYGTGLTMAQAEPGVACIPFNLIADVANGGLTPAEEAFLYRTATGHTSYDQYYLEGSTNGTVFQLPAGPLGASIGFQVRRESIDDTPPPDFVNGNVYNLTTAGVTKGSEDAQEVFGELQVPVIKSFPLVKSFDLNVSGRVSHYSNYGTNGTFKFGVNWKVTDWLAFRATDGSAYRAPALYEQYLANQSGYESQDTIDPCIKWGTTGVSATIIANCKAAGITSPTYDGSAPGSGGSNSAEVFTGGGLGLKPETSQSQTVGIVFTPTWHDLDLKVAATYYSFHVENQIQQFGAANILYQCYDSKTYPNSPFCSLFTRDSNPTSSTYLQITQVNDDYVNVAEQIDQGLDVDITYITHLPADVKMTIDSHLDWTFYTNTILLGGQTNNYLGQVGQPAFEGNLDFKFDKGPWTVNYYIYFVGKSSDNDFVGNINNDYLLSGETVQYNHVVPFYSDSAVSVRRKFDTFTVEVGVKNLFDTPPPYYSNGGFQYRTGVVPLASQYDWIGRSVFIDLRKKF
jgi:iron complex outermembrane receptor protein